jgi:hypothetical protein
MEDERLTKITAKLYPPFFADFEKRIGDLLLRRDAFFDRLIAAEIPNLRAELKGKRLSEDGNRYISRCLKQIGGSSAPPLQQVSITIRHATAEALRAVVKDHNLVRDAFLNRILLMFRSSDKFLEAMELPNRLETGAPHWLDYKDTNPQTSPIARIESVLSDPFYYLRIACETEWKSIYLMPLPDNLMGLYCFIDDEEVPGTSAYIKREEERARLDALIEALEQKMLDEKSKVK